MIVQLKQLLADSATQNHLHAAADQQVTQLQEALRAAEHRAIALQNGVSDGVSRIAQLDQERTQSESARLILEQQAAERIQAAEAELEGALCSATAVAVLCHCCRSALLLLSLCRC